MFSLTDVFFYKKVTMNTVYMYIVYGIRHSSGNLYVCKLCISTYTVYQPYENTTHNNVSVYMHVVFCRHAAGACMINMCSSY